MDDKETVPIFFDGKGRRWRLVRVVLFTLLIVTGFGLYYMLPQAWAQQTVQAFNQPLANDSRSIADPASGISPDAVAAVASKTNTPVIGSGPLVRVVHVQSTPEGRYASILYSSLPARPLTESERAVVAGHEFVLERYGELTAAKQIALTFDDGPDPVYTPQILDVLAKHKVQASFFVTGANVVKHPEIAAREVREGHLIANHTFNHVDFDRVAGWRGRQEINQTERVISAATGTVSSFFRLPYMGTDEQSMRNHLLGILTAQEMGYTIASNHYDSSDWGFETGVKPQLPQLDGSSMVVLLHDAGGDRSQTLAYTEQLIKQAKAAGYTFVNLNQMYSQQPALYVTAEPSLADRASLAAASAVLVWPHQLMGKLFIFTVATLLMTMVINVVLAAINIRRSKYGPRRRGYEPLVSVLVPAYNEDKVLAKTIRSLSGSRYRNQEVIIVDDGSADDTLTVAKRLARRYKRVRCFALKKNSGKAAALNLALSKAKGEVVIIIDADTIFPAPTISRLVRHFHDPAVGAVAGYVKVGNIINMVTRWQALDYTVGIAIERNAQALLGAVLIVPGACGAWRRSALLEVGGYSRHTLAEDFDLTLSLQRRGYTVVQDNDAISYTEVPATVRTLSKQRFRWIYGNVQAYWKHRDMLFRRRYGWTGMVVLPASIVGYILPVFFVPLLCLVALENILAGDGLSLLIYLAVTIAIQFVVALVGIILTRERLSLLLAVPLTRIMYSPLRTMLLYRTVLSILRGVAVGWNKLQRTGAVDYLRLKPVSRSRPVEQEEAVNV